MLFPSEQTSRPHAWRMTSRETSRPRDRTPRRTTSQAACRRTGGSPDGRKSIDSEETSARSDPARGGERRDARDQERYRRRPPDEPAAPSGLPNSMLFRHPRSRRKLGGHGARARRMRGWAARAASATHGANHAQPRRAGKTPNATERVPKRPFRTNVSRETSAAVTRAPTATQTKTPAPRSGTGASCAKRGPSTPQRPKGRAGCSTRTP